MIKWTKLWFEEKWFEILRAVQVKSQTTIDKKTQTRWICWHLLYCKVINRLKSKTIRILSTGRGPIAVIFSRCPIIFSCITTMIFHRMPLYELKYHCNWSLCWFSLQSPVSFFPIETLFRFFVYEFYYRWLGIWNSIITMAFIVLVLLMIKWFFLLILYASQANPCCTRIKENGNNHRNTFKNCLFFYLKKNKSIGWIM